ncbi:MAG: hypothetical protein JWP32_2471 [Schumannella sp.]|nr:hypothetical protein [Schumannella sp.]
MQNLGSDLLGLKRDKPSQIGFTCGYAPQWESG